MRRRVFLAGAVALGLGFGGGLEASAADLASPVGSWRTIDDQTNKPRAVVQIYAHQGLLYGQVTKIIDPRFVGAICHNCRGYAEKKPVVGLVILNGLHPDGTVWDDGTILDPSDGRIYRCRLHLTEGGHKLVVRGYLGTPLFGRTQIWERLADNAPGVPAQQAALP